MMNSGKCQIILAPSDEEAIYKPNTVFLAGTTTASDHGPTNLSWREEVKRFLADYAVTIYDPLRKDWSPEVEEAQTRWELSRQEQAKLLVVHFGPNTDAPVSLLELGLAAGRLQQRDERAGAHSAEAQQKILVSVASGYSKSVNVRLVCERHGIAMVEMSELGSAIVKLLALDPSKRDGHWGCGRNFVTEQDL